MRRISFLFCLLFVLKTFAQHNLKGNYLNKVNSVSSYRLKIIPINDTLTYYELAQINPTNKYINENRTMGVSVKKKNKYYPLSSFSFQKKLYFEALNDSTFFINPDLISFYPSFKDFGGSFFKEKSSSFIKPDFSLFYREKYYYEYSIIEPDLLELFRYPVNSGHKSVIKLMKGMEVRSYANLYDCKTNDDSFFYVAIRKKGGDWKYGWMDGSQFNKLHFLWKVRNGQKWIKDE